MEAVRVIPFATFNDFLLGVHRERAGSIIDQRRFWYRGQASSIWRLETTLDRFLLSRAIRDRTEASAMLEREFRRLAVGIDVLPAVGGTALALLQRHHGLPSALLDWSMSPYVAAYFACADMSAAETLAVWMLDTSTLSRLRGTVSMLAETIEAIDDVDLLAANPRAVEQQAASLAIWDGGPLEGMVPAALTRFEFPASERRSALERLDAVGINHRQLFRDLDSAAKTATDRIARHYASKESP
jgi:hypothetical protein